MQVESEAEYRRLQAALRDLVALSAIPATWVGSDPPAVATRLADTLVELVQLDFAFVRLSDPGGVGAVEATRGTAWKTFPEWLQGHLAASAPFPRKQIVSDAHDDLADLRGFVVPVGVNGEGGLVAAASERSDFPTAIEQLLLSVAANHAAAAFQNARLIHERKRAEQELRKARNELEVKVDERTAELHVANDELSALRRIATLVAQGLPPGELFSSVSDEVGRLFASDLAAVVKFDHDDAAIVFVGLANGVEGKFPIGTRWDVDEPAATAEVYRTGRSARLDPEDWASADSPVGQRLNIVSSVASPIVVEGRLWGAITVASTHEQLPLGIEDHLEKFTALVATAIANAESRAALKRLADEQAALRRVAVLVAQQPAPDEIFTAVTEEIGRLLGADLAAMHIFPGDGTATTIAGWTAAGPMVPIGTRLPLDSDGVAARIFCTGEAARMDSYVDVDGETADVARGLSLRSTVGAPILVDGKLWGALMAATRGGVPLPEEAESRIAAFTELVATAVSNVQAREDVHRLADEQAALRRVATLVALGTPPEELFAAVAEEVGRLLGAGLAGMARYESDDTVTVVATWAAEGDHGGAHPLVSGPWPLEGDDLASTIARTHRPVRIDTYEGVHGRIAAFVRDELGVGSSVGSPIVVEGRLWGALFLHSKQTHAPLPPDTESRLTDFTELVGTAIANTQAQAEVGRLAEEQAALQRVATLVAKEAAPAEVFAKVAEEAGSVLGNVDCGLLRDDGDGRATVVAASGAAISSSFPVGTRLPADGEGVVASVLREGRTRRIDDYSAAPGATAERARESGIGSAVGCPIVVRGGIWGALVVATSGERPCPPETERRIAQFADLVATAIGNAEARAEVERLADEQAALRRVATLVSEGVPPADMFSAVSEEVTGLFGSSAAVLRFDDAGPAITFVGISGFDIPIGTRWEFAEGMTSAEVYRTGRSARVDAMKWSPASGPVASTAQRLGIASTVASPIVVEGHLWGAISVSSADDELPLGIEGRLEKFAGHVATAIANADSRAELAASRRRIVAASDGARRRIERDLHDGTQQRLVSLGLAVRAAEANVPPDRSDLRAELSVVATGLADAVEELQELSRGIHPGILSQGGLAFALRTLARRSAVPVALEAMTDARLPEAIEVAAYYVASEALANATKHAQASRIEISVRTQDGTLLLEIRDDGVGGADPAGGSGLVGLTDRVEALGGSIRVQSRPGDGTHITAVLPLELKAVQEASATPKP